MFFGTPFLGSQFLFIMKLAVILFFFSWCTPFRTYNDILLSSYYKRKKKIRQVDNIDRKDEETEKECADADGLVFSVDMLLYGGLVPSRIHCDTEESLQKRLTVLKDIRKRNPEMVIYGFQVVMRCPNYSSSDEEPDYYGIYGAQIHKAGEVLHKDRLGISHKVLMYPGADEVGLTLISRILNHLMKRRPKNNNSKV